MNDDCVIIYPQGSEYLKTTTLVIYNGRHRLIVNKSEKYLSFRTQNGASIELDEVQCKKLKEFLND